MVKNILENEMNLVERVITFFLRCLRVFKTGESRTKEVFFNISKLINGVKILYLRRWFIWETKQGNLYLHRIVKSDSDRDPHTHPFRFISFILWNGYFDIAYKIVQGLKSKHLVATIEQTKLFHIYDRPASHLHKVLLFKPAWTLVWVGKYDRENEWGFVLEDGTFVPYREYLGLPANAPIECDRIEKQGV